MHGACDDAELHDDARRCDDGGDGAQHASSLRCDGDDAELPDEPHCDDDGDDAELHGACRHCDGDDGGVPRDASLHCDDGDDAGPHDACCSPDGDDASERRDACRHCDDGDDAELRGGWPCDSDDGDGSGWYDGPRDGGGDARDWPVARQSGDGGDESAW